MEIKDFDKRIDSVLHGLDIYAHCGGSYYDIRGPAKPRIGRAFCRLCAACVKHVRAGNFCRQAATAGAYQSLVMGDVHHFRCWLGLYALVIPVSHDGKEITGAIEIGGLLLKGELQEIQHKIIATLSAIDQDEQLPQFINVFQGVEEIAETDIANMGSFLKEAMFSSGLLNVDQFMTNNAIWLQQKRIANEMQTLGAVGDRRKRVLIVMDELITFSDRGEESAVRRKVDELLGLILLESSEDINSVKAFLIPTLSILSMQAILKGENWSKAITINSLRMEEMGKIDDLKKLCFWFETLVVGAFQHIRLGRRDNLLSDKVIAYLHRHFQENVKLDSVVKCVGASTSSIMHKLKRETGKTFSQHLNEIRIKEAKRLLTFTSLPLGEISLRCGFRDQSYFTKVFTRNVNIVPKAFRKMLTIETR